MKRSHVLSLVLCLSIGTPLLSQKQDITCKLHIFEKGNAKPLHHVEVLWGEKFSKKTDSNAEGIVSIEIPAEGEGIVRFVRGAYEPLEVRYSQLRPPGDFNIFLIPNVEGENLIVVTGTKTTPQISRRTISIQEASKAAPNADPVQIIKTLPGVQSREFRPQPSIRGSGPDDSQYYIDDLQVPFIFHSIGDLSVIPGSFIQDVRLDNGGFGPEKGDATGGIIVVHTKKEIPDQPKTEFVFNVPFYSGILHTRPLDKQSAISVGLRRSYVDIIIRHILAQRNKREGKQNGNLSFVPYFGDGQLIYWENTDTGFTKLSLIGAYDGLKAAFPSDSFADVQGQASVEFYTAFANLGLEHSTRLGSWQMRTTPQVYYNKTEADFFGQSFQSRNWVTRVPTEWTKHLTSNLDVNLGIDPALHFTTISYNAILFNNTDPTFDPEDAPISNASFSLRYVLLASWVNFDQKLGNFTLSPGLRVFHNSEIQKASADPRLRARYALNETHAIKGAVGQYSESPSTMTASPQIGNPKLDYERSYHYALGLESHWNQSWSTEFQFYYKTAFQIVENDALRNYDNNGSFKSYGLEAFIRRALTERFFTWISYTFSRTIARETKNQAFHNSEYDETHMFYLVGNYRLSSLWEVGGRFNAHSGDTYTPIAYGVYNTSLDNYQARTNTGSNNSARLPFYYSLSFYFGHDWLYNRAKLTLRFGMESFWFQPQVLGVNYNYDYTKTNKETGISSIPFLELRGEF